MGSIARMDRCNRFIVEFNDLAKKLYDFSEFPSYVQSGLGTGFGSGVVRLYVMFGHKGREEELIYPTIFFCGEEMDEDTINRVCDLFQLEEGEAVERLKRAKLIGGS